MTTPDTASTEHHRLRSDFVQVLRFVAAGLVLLTHVTFYFHDRLNANIAVWHDGEIGVPIFFVISGLVIVLSSASLPTDASGAGRFMGRRLLRILPLYWLVTAIKVAVALTFPSAVLHNHFDPVYALKSFFFIPAFNPAGQVQPIHGVGWTLLHEMFFYACFALAMCWRLRPVLSVTVWIIALACWGHFQTPGSPFLIVATHPINLCFVAGMMVGQAVLRGGITSRQGQMTAAGIVALMVVQATWPVGTATFLPKTAVLVLAMAMLLMCSWRIPPRFQLLVDLGASSYALYLFHPIMAPAVLMVINKAVPALPAGLKMAVTVGLVVVAAHGVHRLLELPLGRWLRHVAVSRLAGRKMGAR